MLAMESVRVTATDLFPQVSDDERFLFVALGVAFILGLFWWFNRNAKEWLEEHGSGEESTNALDWRLGDRPQKPATPLKYSEQEFQEMVEKALDEVPEEFDKEWNNVAVTVSTDWPTEADKKRLKVPKGHLLFGTYSGTSRTKGYRASSSSPHVIVIYQPALEKCYGADKDRLEQEIRHVVLHELAHHLGMSHNRMKEIGL
jgi:predicted Zn-dependent protease with MMP-like domain